MLMWNSPERGVWTGDYQEFARVTGLPWESAPRIIIELKKVATVTDADNLMTLVNRRMKNIEKRYKNHANRQRQYIKRRSNDKKVTNQTSQEPLRIHKTTTAEGGVYEPPDKVKDPNGFLVWTYKKGLGVAPDDRAWDKRFWGRWAKQSQAILEALGGIEESISFLRFWAQEHEARGLQWNLRTIADKAVSYAAKQRGKANGSSISKGVSGPAVKPETDPGPGGMGETVSIGPILASLRDRQEVKAQT